MRVNGVVVSTPTLASCCYPVPGSPGLVTGHAFRNTYQIDSTGEPPPQPFQTCNPTSVYRDEVSADFDAVAQNPILTGTYSLDTVDVYCEPESSGGPFDWRAILGCAIQAGSPLPLNACDPGAFDVEYTHARYDCSGVSVFSLIRCHPATNFGPGFHLLIQSAGVSYSRSCSPEPGAGACCCNGHCIECHDQAACAAAGGLWKGAGSKCGEVDCRTLGRCCIPGFGCANTEQGDCLAIGGSWSVGACAQNGEPCAPEDPTIPGGAVGRSLLMFVPLIGGRF